MAGSFFGDLWETLTGRSVPVQSRGEYRHGGICIDGLGPCDQRSGCGYDDEFPDAGIHPVGTPHCILHGYSAGDHRSCVINTGPYCGEPVTQGQIDEGDAHPIDERGVNDGRYEHDWCVQGGE